MVTVCLTHPAAHFINLCATMFHIISFSSFAVLMDVKDAILTNNCPVKPNGCFQSKYNLDNRMGASQLTEMCCY